MSEWTVKIAKQSKIILILAKVARIVLFVALGATVFLLISTWVPGDMPLLRIGGTDVFLTVPLKTLLGAETAEGVTRSLESFRLDLGVQLLSFVLAQIMLRLVTRLFTGIRESENPFTPGIIKTLKTLAVLLGLVVAVQNTLLGVVITFTVFAFALIFEYGGELQHQVDETL